jgi:siroheme synthase-like protein
VTATAPRPRLTPLLLDLVGRRCVVVGAGAIGARRAETLLAGGADVTLVDPAPSRAAEDLAARGARIERRAYAAGDLDGAVLAVAATGNPQVDEAVHRDADAGDILCNVASNVEECSVVFPSVLNRGDVVVAASTGGASPALAARLRDHLAAAVGPEWGALADLMGELRPRLRDRYPDSGERSRAVDRLMESDVMALLAADDRAGARRTALSVLGVA